MLSKLINLLQNSQADDKTLLYVSDHGESLGEKGLYLHGFPYALAPKEQTQVPMLFWSNKLADTGFNQCIEQQRNQAFSHDNIFDTLLGLTHVQSTEYHPEQDIFNTCSTQS